MKISTHNKFAIDLYKQLSMENVAAGKIRQTRDKIKNF